MSRTKRGSKPPGYEYWSRRPGNRHGGIIGPDQKRYTHRAERAKGRRMARWYTDTITGDDT